MIGSRVKDNRGFSILELMMVIAILGTLTSIGLSNYIAYREKAYNAACLSHQQSIRFEAQADFVKTHTFDPELINDYGCPQGGVYVWQSMDPDDPEFGQIICSLHGNESDGESTSGTSEFKMPSGENISENNDFENLDRYPGNRGWARVNTDDVDGWESNGDTMEIWADGMLGVDAPGGDYFIELDTTPGIADKIYQEVETEEGRVYEIKFQARTRTTGTSDVVVSWGGEEQETITPEKGEWNEYTIRVVGSGEAMEVALSEVEGQNNGLGTLLDAIEIIPLDEQDSP